MRDPNLAHLKIMGGIGHVCLQWALLETTLMAVLNLFVKLVPEEGAVVFGGLDMLGRLNMAINLADHHKAPFPIGQELRNIRKALQNGILDARNQAIHGAHADADEPDSVNLTMFRWPKPKRMQTKSFEDFAKLAIDIENLQRRAFGVFQHIGAWKGGYHGAVDGEDDLTGAPSVPRLKFTKRLNAAFQHFWRRFWG
jgi:hypothetical protein